MSFVIWSPYQQDDTGFQCLPNYYKSLFCEEINNNMMVVASGKKYGLGKNKYQVKIRKTTLSEFKSLICVLNCQIKKIKNDRGHVEIKVPEFVTEPSTPAVCGSVIKLPAFFMPLLPTVVIPTASTGLNHLNVNMNIFRHLLK